MDKNTMTARPHAVCVPCPAQGHINAVLQLAKLLHHKFGFHVTFVHTEPNYARILDKLGPSALAGAPGFRFVSIPVDSPDSDGSVAVDGSDLSKFCADIRRHLAGPFRRLLERLEDSAAGGLLPRVTCVVADTFANFAVGVAAELGIRAVSFCPVSACGLMAFYSYKELVDTGVVPLKSESDMSNGYLNTPISLAGMRNMRLKDLGSFIQTNSHESLINFCKDEVQDALKASAIIMNTFDELEGPVLAALSSRFPPMYTVGPLNLPCREILDDALHLIGSSMWKNDANCLPWLDGRSPCSVLYMNLGSLAVMTKQQLVEFAEGLADSGYDFLWVMRPESLKDDGSGAGLSEEFMLETKERGLITSWCPQEEVLRHPSVGGFLTHCGWNSTLEGITGGVPMICWPYFADQPGNCRYLSSEWGVGVEIKGIVERKKVEEVIREVMGGEKGAEMRRMAKMWKEEAENSVKSNGKSFVDLERVVKEVLLHSHNS